MNNDNPVTLRDYLYDNIPMLPGVSLLLTSALLAVSVHENPIMFANAYDAAPYEFWGYYILAVVCLTGVLTIVCLFMYPLVLLLDRILYGKP